MKKKFFGAVVVVAITAGAMINVNFKKVSNKSNLELANIEALAQGENYNTFRCNSTIPVVCIIDNNVIRFGLLTNI